MKKIISGVLVLLFAVSLSGCTLVSVLGQSQKSDDNAHSEAALGAESSPPSSSEEDASSSSAPVPEPAQPQIGEAVAIAGVTLTVARVDYPATVQMVDNNMRQGSGYETYADVPPRAGGKFVLVEAAVKNTGATSMDLTCGLPVVIKAVSVEGQMFDQIESLYKLRGNPACNSGLQPGFESPMTWVFLVPETADVAGVIFYDLDEGRSNAGSVAFGPQYTIAA